MESLMDHLKHAKPSGFRPSPFYSEEGDAVTFFAKDEPHYRHRVDNLLTMYLSRSTDELVGCEVKGISRMLEIHKQFGLSIKDAKLTLGLLFAVYAWSQLQDRQQVSYDVVKQLAGIAEKAGSKELVLK